MGFIIGESGKWSIEARRESFYLVFEETPDNAITIEPLYGDIPTLIGAIEMLKAYLEKEGRLHQIGDQYIEELVTK